MIEPAAKDVDDDFAWPVVQDFAHQPVDGFGCIVDEFRIGRAEACTGGIGRRRAVGMRRQHHHFIGPKSELAEPGPDQICKLGADHHQVEAQDQATAAVALQQQCGNFDCVEDGGDRPSGARRNRPAAPADLSESRRNGRHAQTSHRTFFLPCRNEAPGTVASPGQSSCLIGPGTIRLCTDSGRGHRCPASSRCGIVNPREAA